MTRRPGSCRSRFGTWAERCTGFADPMSRCDRKAWASAASLADIGELTVAWLCGDLTQTPSHCGPPDEETRPHIEVLCAANLSGFITDGSQSASGVPGPLAPWNAWVTGFLAEPGLAQLEAVAAGTGLSIQTRCRGRDHYGHKGRWLNCPRRDLDSFYGDRCPLAGAEIRAAWHVMLADPEPGRNDRLWPALAEFAAARVPAMTWHAGSPS